MNQSIIDKYIKNINSGNTKYLYYLANYYKEYNDYTNMVKYYLEATEVDPIKAGQLINSYLNKDTLKYYLIEVENNNKYAMNAVGLYYEILNDKINMKKYYIMAINNECILSMSNLAYYYQEEADYNNMMKYYLMGIEKNDNRSINLLGIYYHKQNDYINMMKYYQMGIQNLSVDSMANLGIYYKKQKDYQNMIKYYLMAVQQGDVNSMNQLGLYYKELNDYNNTLKYCNMAISKQNADPILLEYIIIYNVELNNYENAIYYFWIIVNDGHFNIIKNLLKYLFECNVIKDVLEFYIICCENTIYNEHQLNDFKNIINIKYNDLIKYGAQRIIKICKFINKFINCNDISTLICDY
jgi:tetratricopeptide (TPR) repeat protein